MAKTVKIAVIGAGAWGTALSKVLSENGHDVALWSRNTEVISEINNKNKNSSYLPDIFLPRNINATRDFKNLEGSDALFLVTPAQNIRMLSKALQEIKLGNIPIVICSKGIEQETLKLMSEIVSEMLPANKIAVLSGPNFADEIARGLPAASTLACKDKKSGEDIVGMLNNNNFRIYLSDDVIGAEIGGAVKNVIAIACGIAVGRNLGENARAALITRGLAEIARLAKAKGGRPETLMGLAGMGDLVLTCSSLKSRNMSLGYELGQGKPLQAILKKRQGKVTEGLTTTHSVQALAASLKVEMPITETVYNILYKEQDIDIAIKSLLERPVRPE